jgi:hypothetical protein
VPRAGNDLILGKMSGGVRVLGIASDRRDKHRYICTRRQHQRHCFATVSFDLPV